MTLGLSYINVFIMCLHRKLVDIKITDEAIQFLEFHKSTLYKNEYLALV